MRTAAIAVFLLLVLASTSGAQETRIHAIVAIEMKAGCADAVGFAIEAGAAADSGKVRKLVQEKVRAAYPQARNNLNADNFMKDKHLGNHVRTRSASWARCFRSTTARSRSNSAKRSRRSKKEGGCQAGALLTASPSYLPPFSSRHEPPIAGL